MSAQASLARWGHQQLVPAPGARRLSVLDLFSGLGGWSAAFVDSGHEVVTVEKEARFNPTICADVRKLRVADRRLIWRGREYGPFDLILDSPPCEAFSVMNIGRNWTHDNQPKTETARLGVELVLHSLYLIRELAPTYFVIENPRGKLRKLAFMQDLERRTVTYCHYGESRMKPTDLWGGFPPSLVLAPACKNGDPCHTAAPRGSRTGTQGYGDYWEKARVPYALSRAICAATERDILGPSESGRAVA